MAHSPVGVSQQHRQSSVRRSACVVQVVAVALLGTMALSHERLYAQDERGGVLPDVVAVWKAREAAIDSLEMRWDVDVDHLTANGEHVTIALTGNYVFDPRGRIRFEGASVHEGRRGNQPLRAESSVSAFDANAFTCLYPVNSKGFPSAIVRGGDTRLIANDIRLAAVNLAFRPLHPAFRCFSANVLRQTGRQESVFDQPCLILGAGEHDVWVTDDSRRLITRMLRRSDRNQQPLTDVQIEYETSTQNPTIAVPKRWVARVFGSSEEDVIEMRSARVTEIQLNPVLNAEQFAIAFPNGTWVQNLLSNESYIIREGQPNRPVLKGEYTGDNYKLLLSTEPGSPDAARDSATDRRRLWLWLGYVLVILAAISTWVWTARRAAT